MARHAYGRIQQLSRDSTAADDGFLVEDVLRFATLARSEQPAGSLFRATDGHPARSHRYRELNQVQGLGDELRGVFRSGRGVWGFVSLYRGEDAQPFRPAAALTRRTR